MSQPLVPGNAFENGRTTQHLQNSEGNGFRSQAFVEKNTLFILASKAFKSMHHRLIRHIPT